VEAALPVPMMALVEASLPVPMMALVEASLPVPMMALVAADDMPSTFASVGSANKLLDVTTEMTAADSNVRLLEGLII